MEAYFNLTSDEWWEVLILEWSSLLKLGQENFVCDFRWTCNGVLDFKCKMWSSTTKKIWEFLSNIIILFYFRCTLTWVTP